MDTTSRTTGRAGDERAIVLRITPRRLATVVLLGSLAATISASPLQAPPAPTPVERGTDRPTVTAVTPPMSREAAATAVVTDLFNGDERSQVTPSDESILDVLRRLSPEAAAPVESALKDPAKRDVILEQLRENGRRFYGLALLRDRHQSLYEAKIDVILAQQDTYTAACQYHEARRAGRAEDVSRAEVRLRDAASRAAAADVFAQAQELLALEEHIGQRRIELAHRSDPNYQKEAVRKMVEGFMNSPPPCARKANAANGAAGN
ncbi:MAG: hypothetical protein JNM94_04160 [Phycisphaerae bacterium]|nr:hypothetical protein [Phycisphaerae bacterium]